jgi:1-acyl-sn-glycerol-3-phosphate acyltransferase
VLTLAWLALVLVLSMAYWAVGGLLFVAAGVVLAPLLPLEKSRAIGQRLLQQSIEALRQGDRLLFFPEGTRTRKQENPINTFLGGIGIIATQSSAPVWPVFIETNSDYLCKGWPLWRLPDRKIKLRITLGEPLASPPDENAAAFTRRLREVYLDALVSDRLTAG